MGSIIDLPKTVGKLKKEDKELFDRFFRMRISEGELVFPKEQIAWADKTFGNHKDVEKQKIVYVLNKFTHEGALFNELRSKRPMSVQSNEDTLAQIHASEGDPFCKPLTGTPKDTFGRITGKYCITASNVAKYDAHHGLIIFNKHNPLEFTEKELQDYFATSLKWFEAAHKKNPKARYPFLLWNCLWKSGASMMHGHMQVVLGEEMHYAEPELYNKLRLDYEKDYGKDYLSDVFSVHKSIGLGFEHKKNNIFVSISPKKDKEVTIVSPKFTPDFVKAIYNVVHTMTKDFGVESFNVCIAFPPLEKKRIISINKAKTEWTGFPIMMHFLDRGKLSNKTTDLGGMEEYARSIVVETDPYKVFEKLKEKF